MSAALITYDVKFNAKYSSKQRKGKDNKLTKLLFDIEAQKVFRNRFYMEELQKDIFDTT